MGKKLSKRQLEILCLLREDHQHIFSNGEDNEMQAYQGGGSFYGLEKDADKILKELKKAGFIDIRPHYIINDKGREAYDKASKK